jgi:hypothetical protein
VVVVAGAVLVGLAHRPSQAQRATDTEQFLAAMNTGIESCAGGVGESLTALHAIQTGTSHDTATAIQIARYGANNCSPANNQPLSDLTQYQVMESLSSFHLDRVVNGLITWAFPDAQKVQTDVADELASHSAVGRARAAAALQRDRRVLNAQRAALDKIMMNALTHTGARAKLPNLPG